MNEQLMNEQQTPAEFNGWAIVEVMGHRKLSGFVTTKAFGSAVMFRVHAPAQEAVTQTIEKRTYVDGQGYLPAGSKISVSRDAFEQWIGVGSIYALTPCSEEQATRLLPQRIVVLERGEEAKQLAAAIEESDADDDDSEDDDCPY